MSKKKKVRELEQEEIVLQFSDGTERVVERMDGKYFYCGDAKFRISRKDIISRTKELQRSCKKNERRTKNKR